MAEDPLGHVAPLFSGLHVRKAEVDAFQDARIHHVVSHIREPVIVERLHWRCAVCGVQSEVHFVGAEEEREAAGRGAGDVVGSRSVIGIVRVVDEWLPIRVADGVRSHDVRFGGQLVPYLGGGAHDRWLDAMLGKLFLEYTLVIRGA